MARSRPEIRQLLAAEYVLGSLRGPARRRFERMRADDAVYCAAVDAWEARLAELVDGLPGTEPSRAVWDAVRREIGVSGGLAGFRRGLWQSARLWRLVALVLALALLCLLLLA
jgi:anti-sigma-K factor RskA